MTAGETPAPGVSLLRFLLLLDEGTWMGVRRARLRWLAGLGLGWLLLGAGAVAAEDREATAAAGLAAADAFLADRSTWPQAIDAFRAHLVAHPEQDDVRLRLARVLSWSQEHEAALEEYGRLLERDPDSWEARVERAEVWSWIGHYEQAADAFGALLAENAGDARAARGLARVYLWSGERARADEAYGQALELEEDADARSEWIALREAYKPWVEVRSGYFDDDAGFHRYESGLHASAHLDHAWRVFGHASIVTANQDGFAKRAAARGRRAHDGDRAWDVALGLEHRFGPSWLASLEAGVRAWRRASDRPYARLAVDWTPRPGTSFLLRASHDDHFDIAESRGSVDEDVHGTYVQLGGWRQWTEQVESYGHARIGFLSDANQLQDGYLEASWRPWRDRPTRLALQGQVLSYTHRTAAYYSPNLSASAAIGIRHDVALASRLSLQFDARAGYGYTRDARVRASGPEWAGGAALEWLTRPWRFRLEARYSQTQRTGSYSAIRIGLRVGRTF